MRTFNFEVIYLFLADHSLDALNAHAYTRRPYEHCIADAQVGSFYPFGFVMASAFVTDYPEGFKHSLQITLHL